MEKVAGLGDIIISSDTSDILKTYALSSCVGITAYSASSQIAGMIHIVLPNRPKNSVSNPSPSYYASTGVPLFINKMQCVGCQKKELVVSVFGGALANRFNDHFNIGLRNINAVKELLTDLGLFFTLVDVGGSISRTIIMDVATGTVKINTLPY